MKKSLSILLAMAVAASCLFTGCSSSDSSSGNAAPDADGVYELRLATDLTTESFMVTELQKACDEVSSWTDGKVQITMYPGQQLGSYPAVHSQLITGDIDMTANYVDPNYDQRLNVFIFPALVEGYDGFKEQMSPGGFLFELLTEVEADMGIKALGAMNSGLMGIGSVKEPAASFAEAIDFNVKKDVLLRIPSMDVYMYLMQGMGYRTTTISYSDLYPALQSGVADGWMGGTAEVNWMSFRDVINYFVDLQVLDKVMPILINQKTYDSLPEEYQTVISEVFFDCSMSIADMAEEQANQSIQNMEGAGITVYEGTEEERAQLFADVRKNNVWPQLVDLIGEDLFNEVTEEFGVDLG